MNFCRVSSTDLWPSTRFMPLITRLMIQKPTTSVTTASTTFGR